MNTNELAHHGVKGQKWGVRRYRNMDGSLTRYGRQRLEEDAAKKEKQNISKGNDMFKNKGVFTQSLEKQYMFEPRWNSIISQPKNRSVYTIYDEYGKVRVSYLLEDNVALAKGKDWCNKNLHKYVKNPKNMSITYYDE